MSNSSTTTGSSSNYHSTDGSSVTSDSYTTTSYSTVDPPTQLHCPNTNQSTISGISDPSASFHSPLMAKMSVFSPVVEETNSALEEASSSFGHNVAVPSLTAPSSDGSGSFVRTSVDAEGVSIEINSTCASSSMVGTSSVVGPMLPLECDYDTNPTELYQAIEGKKWDLIESLFAHEPAKAQRQAATWVTRKETNGRLRWRLLPIHAAVIFQSPANIVERLLHECPEAAHAKDDQGMLPLHLAFRTKSTDWETIEELITSNPQSIFVKDRKGRSPLECGLAAATAAMASEAASKEAESQQIARHASSLMGALSPTKFKTPATPSSSSGRSITPAVQKAIFSVLDLYTQISVQDHLQTAMNSSRQALETRIGAVQDSHVSTLTKLKNDWDNQRKDLSRKIQGYRKEIQSLKSDFNIQQELLEEKVKTEMELVDKLQQVTTALETKTVVGDEATEDVARDITKQHSLDLSVANEKNEGLRKTNKELLLLLETLLDQQNSLKLSLDKLFWEAQAKNQERKEMLKQYLLSNDQSVEATTSYTQEWQSRLESTSIDVSAKLAQILSQSQANPAEGPDPSEDGLNDAHNGEEKKEAHQDLQLLQTNSTGTGSLGSSRQDP